MTTIIVGEVGDILEEAARHLGKGCPTSWEKLGDSRKNDKHHNSGNQKTGCSNFSAKIRK